jgi:purine-binding chemotaxis protein CheW
VAAKEEQSLICRVGERRCALPVSAVAEVLRLLPEEAIANAPAFVRGVSIVRGEAVPVVDAARLLGEGGSGPTRLVVLELGGRRVGLAVDACEDIRTLDRSAMAGMPPLLREASEEVVTSIGVLDGRLLERLEAARLVPAEVLEALGREAAA